MAGSPDSELEKAGDSHVCEWRDYNMKGLIAAMEVLLDIPQSNVEGDDGQLLKANQLRSVNKIISGVGS